ncbi:MAG: NifU family protein [Flavobacteriales bacterium]|nr:NifU family protein [Flavobacteriales bacterium]
MATERTIPVSVYAEMTPNPATMRFVANRPLLPDGAMLEFRQVEEAEGVSPFAERLFNLPFVTAVFLTGNAVTITRNDKVTWDLVQLELREHIQELLNEDPRVLYGEAPAVALAEANQRAMSHADPTNAEDAQIVSLLDEYVRPAVEADGGHIAFRHFKEGVVTVALQGSCSGCPSSMVTLKGGIENLLKQMMPGVKEVVAEEL